MEVGMRQLVAAAVVAVSVLSVPAVRADDVKDQINEALSAYDKKDLATATAALEAALGLLRQARAEVWKTVLPEAPQGWQAGEVELAAMGVAMMGGGTTAKRDYTKGEETVEISLLSDSPMIQGMAMMFSGAMSGPDNKLVVIDGRRMMYSKSDNAYQTIVANKVLVKIEGSQGVDDPTLRTFLKAVKFAEIEKQAQ
jgi:hypothetical protein